MKEAFEREGASMPTEIHTRHRSNVGETLDTPRPGQPRRRELESRRGTDSVGPPAGWVLEAEVLYRSWKASSTG